MTERDDHTPPPDDAPQQTARAVFAEVGVVYLIMFALVLALALGALGVGLIANNLYVLVAAVFLGVPWLIMDRRGLAPEAPNLTRRDHLKGLGWGFLFTIGTLIPFALGNHVWETQARHRALTPDLDRLWQWPTSADGEPRGWGNAPGVWVWTTRQEVHIGARAAAGPPPRLLLEADTPFLPARTYSGLRVEAIDTSGAPLTTNKQAHAPHTRWALTPIVHARPVRAVLRAGKEHPQPHRLTVRVEAPAGKPALPLMLGPDAAPLSTTHTTLDRSLGWLLAWWITQLFFIAWPEEYAYRGYLQGRLATAFGLWRRERDASAPATERQALGITPSIVATSVLFGLGHLLIPVQGVLLASRASVFFPSLLFGWLRLRSGTLAASTLYHASCNMMVIIITTQYA